MKLSIVTTLFNSAHYINEFYCRMKETADKITQDYEMIFVDDGSPDNSLEITQSILMMDTKVQLIELSRNFGHHKAMMVGLQHARGDYVFLIDSDLEEDPELLLEFWQALHSDAKQDVIYGIQIERKGRWFERWSGHVYYALLNRLSDEVKTAKNISTVRLMKKNYVASLIKFKEYICYFGPIAQLAGFHQKGYLFKKHSKDVSSYSFLKKYHIFLDSIISFSSKPLYFIFYFGICITMLSFSYLSYLIARKLFLGIAIQGWTSLMVVTSLFGGINMFFIGLLSVYILHIFQETKNRPFSIVKKIHKLVEETPRIEK